MPGVNGPADEQLYRIIAGLNQRVRALETQQQQTITNAVGQALINFGLVPGSNPARYGLQFLDPTTGTEQLFMGEDANGAKMHLSVEGGSSIAAYDPNTNLSTALIGPVGFQAPPSGGQTSQMTTTFWRADGTVAFSISDLNGVAGHTFQQSMQLFDRTGHVVVADDANGGVGLALPYLQLPFKPVTVAEMPSTTSSSYVPLEWCSATRLGPRFSAAVLCYSSDSTTTGEVQITDGTNQIGPTLTVAAGSFAAQVIGPIAWPSWTYKDKPTLVMQAHRTAGSGTIAATVIGAQSEQS